MPNLNPVVTSFEPIPFLNNLSNFTSSIHDMHQQIKSSLNELCNLKDAKQAMIDGIRQDYSTKLDTVNQITDNFLNY